MLSTAQAGASGRGRFFTFQYLSWTGSIKPSLQHFHLCCVGWSERYPIVLFLSPQQRCLCRVAAVKSLPVHLIRAVIFRSFRIVQHSIYVVFVEQFSFIQDYLGSGGSNTPASTALGIVELPLAYGVCFLILSFDSVSVICRLHNLRSPFQIPFV